MSDELGMKLYHGGVPGLRRGDLIEPGHQREVDGCAICAARNKGETLGFSEDEPIDPPTVHTDKVYVTTHKLYALFYASLYFRGDLYTVEPIGDLDVPEDGDPFESYVCDGARVLMVYQRAVTLKPSQRSRLLAEWERRDKEMS